jgi:hypothetical protein
MATAQTTPVVKPSAAQVAQATGNAKSENKANAKKAKETRELIVVKAGAISKDVGLQILSVWDQTDKMERKAEEMLTDAANKRYDALAGLTLAIKKAAEHDDGIDLNSAFRSENKSAVNKLNDQIRITVGLMEYKELSTGVKKLDWTKDAAKITSKWTATQRTNFAHMLKKCAQAAAALIDTKADVKFVKEEHTLLISGPAVQKEFGQSSVLLNERQKVGEGEKAITLAKRPSFQALADIGKLKRDIVPARRADSRAANAGPTGKVNMTSDAAFVSLCNNLVGALNSLAGGEGLSEVKKKAAHSVKNALDKVLA